MLHASLAVTPIVVLAGCAVHDNSGDPYRSGGYYDGGVHRGPALDTWHGFGRGGFGHGWGGGGFGDGGGAVIGHQAWHDPNNTSWSPETVS